MKRQSSRATKTKHGDGRNAFRENGKTKAVDFTQSKGINNIRFSFCLNLQDL